MPYLGDHIRQNVIGAVAPQSGGLFSLMVDGVDTDVFQLFLEEMAKAIPKKEGIRQVLIMDIYSRRDGHTVLARGAYAHERTPQPTS